MSDPRYDVLTWDMASQQYTEQDGMESRCLNVTKAGLRRVLRELRNECGYSCHRVRDSFGGYDSDPSVLVERVDCPVADEALELL